MVRYLSWIKYLKSPRLPKLCNFPIFAKRSYLLARPKLSTIE